MKNCCHDLWKERRVLIWAAPASTTEAVQMTIRLTYTLYIGQKDTQLRLNIEFNHVLLFSEPKTAMEAAWASSWCFERLLRLKVMDLTRTLGLLMKLRVTDDIS